MTNFEWLMSKGHEQLKTMLSHDGFGVDTITGECVSCHNISCLDCRFTCDDVCCETHRLEWLNASHAKFQKGDLVKIINPGSVYSSYVDWVIDNVDDKTLLAKWAYEKSLLEEDSKYMGHTFRVMVLGSHVDREKTLIYIQDTSYSGECFLIDEDGVEKI